jgi:hypothetical protein
MRSTWLAHLAARSVLATSLSLAACDGIDDVDNTENGVVGGRAESGYPAAGYLWPYGCGATLIAPDVAVTAAHCVEGYAPTSLAYGVGTWGSGQITYATAIFIHPQYGFSYEHDVAVMILGSPVQGVTPAAIAPPAVACNYRYIGYGRVTPGGPGVNEGYTFERKSMGVCVDAIVGSDVYNHGIDGGNCWGDSGGALMIEGANQLVGVLSRFSGPPPYSCAVGDAMIHTSLAGESAFLSQFLPPTGTIQASPCTIAQGSNTCTSQISWSSSNAQNPCVLLRETGTLFAWGTSGTSAAPWINSSGYTFDLRNGSTPSAPLLATIRVSGVRATIGATPNPCALGQANGVCTTTLSWNSNAPNACVVLRESSTPVACAAAGSVNLPWITQAGYNLDLRNGSTASAPLLGSVHARGMVSGTSCTPTTCAAQGKNCGTISNGCGGTLTCGGCTSPQTCGGGGVANVCGGGGGGGATFTLSASPASVARNGSIAVSWTAPAGQTSSSDWIGLYVPGAANTTYVDWQYTTGQTTGSRTFVAPSTAGTYQFRYLRNNGYASVATSNNVTVNP